MDKIKIALLDSGIDVNNEDFMKYVYKGESILLEGKQCYITKKINDDNGHGSLCASVILKECNNIEFYILKITNGYNLTNLQILEFALNHLLSEEINIISMSVSIVSGRHSKKLKQLCNLLYKKGIAIVCSVSNGRNKSYPASFKSVFSVRGFILENEEAIWERKKGKEFVVDSNPYLHLSKAKQYMLFGKCNSYACAKMSGIVARTMLEINDCNITNVKKEICNKAIRHSWNTWIDFRKSKRFPCFKNESDCIEYKILEVLCLEFDIQSEDIFYTHSLFDKNIGLTYEKCGELLEKIQSSLHFNIENYSEISRYNFYSIYTLTDLIRGYLRNEKKEK